MQIAWPPQQDGDPRYTWLCALVHEAVRGLRIPTGV